MICRRGSIPLVALALLLPSVAAAQAPFDMSPERQAAPVKTIPGSPAAPAGAGSDGGTRQTNPPVETAPASPSPPVTAPARQESADIDRYIIPSANLRFEGEMGRRSWGVVLTPEQAAHDARLAVTYNSSIYVAPEDSHLRVSVNDQLVLDQPLAAREAAGRVTVPLPAGTLVGGTNILTFTVIQRHRTDCTVESTYDLWTEIGGAGTGLLLGGDQPDLTSVSDLGAVGFDATGRTTLELILPAGEQSLSEANVLSLVQAITLRGNYRQPLVRVVASPDPNAGAGTLQVAVGTARELAAIPGLPADAEVTPVAALVPTAGRAPLLVVSGPDRIGVASAIDLLAKAVARPSETVRSTINTTPSQLPPVPLLSGNRMMTFSELGVPTEEFSGRRFHTDFSVGMPGDFYAESYGEATILLDAAYTEAVKPGSHIDVYVNGFIAATTPLTSTSGDIFRHLPIKVALTHFRPGVNRITVEAQLHTDADTVCAPGAAGAGPDRFVVFDTSEFHMPDFARIGRWPSLSALVGTGTPYGDRDAPVQIVLGRADNDVYAATATLLARLAISSGGPIPIAIARPESLGNEPALFVGAISQFSIPTLAAMGIDEAAQTSWVRKPAAQLSDLPVAVDPGKIAPATFGDQPTTEGVYQRWQEDVVNPTGLRGTWFAFENWLQRTFDLSFSALRVTSSPERPFNPPARATLLVAEAPASQDRPWTMIAAPTEGDLAGGIGEITKTSYWSTLAGRVASFSASAGIEDQPPASRRFVLGDNLSLRNLRLVAANWLSTNIVTYALALVIICGILGIATSALLARLGRRS